MLQDTKIDPKIQLAGLWVATILLYLYGDLFSMWIPQKLQGLLDGRMGSGATTPGRLLAVGVAMAIPPFMVALSLTLPAPINRWANVIVGVLYTLFVLLVLLFSSFDGWYNFFILYSIIEIIFTSWIVFTAWRWPREGHVARQSSSIA